MSSLSKTTIEKLLTIQQKKLEKGEIFLLSKAIADTLPLAPADTDSINIYTLQHRRYINNVIYYLNDYTYLDEDVKAIIYKNINELTLWRHSVAHNPPTIMFRGDTNTVIDDISCLLRYVDVPSICSVVDVLDNANWTYSLFRTVAQEILQITKIEKGV